MPSLSDFFLFRELDADSLSAIEQRLEDAVRYHRGDAVYSTDTFRRAVGLVLDGSVTVYALGDSAHRVVMNRLGVGDMFGVAALFDEQSDHYVTEIVADSDTGVCFIDQDTMSRLLAEFPALAETYIRFLSGRIRFLNRKLSVLTDGNAENRLYHYLLSHRDAQGIVHLPGSMTELASTLNMGRSSLYRSLDTLVSSGILCKEGKTYRIL